ncbi:MAG: hypothetical protein ABFR63_00120 [Thermodesulfobacteriota bacterium]
METTHPIESTQSQTKTKATAANEISRVSAVAISVVALSVGLWATTCLFAGTIASGGPQGLIQQFITAVSG